jgi:hypothetical protein
MTRLALVVSALLLFVSSASASPPLPPRPVDIHQFESDYHTLRQHQADMAAQAAESQSTVNANIVRPFEWANAGFAAVQSAQELYQAYQGLTSFDTTCIDISSAGAPPVPSACEENQETCGQCYRDAYRELGDARFKLEKLRCVYQATKNFADKAIAFGDTSSGVHALVGLEWQQQKKRILDSVDELKRSYDGKLGQFLPMLQTSLEHIGQCEQQYMHEPDWYTRFGFIYFTFMNDRYKRKD